MMYLDSTGAVITCVSWFMPLMFVMLSAFILSYMVDVMVIFGTRYDIQQAASMLDEHAAVLCRMAARMGQEQAGAELRALPLRGRLVLWDRKAGAWSPAYSAAGPGKVGPYTSLREGQGRPPGSLSGSTRRSSSERGRPVAVLRASEPSWPVPAPLLRDGPAYVGASQPLFHPMLG